MNNSTFEHGSQWVRADFHLHTRKDKQFSYKGEDDRFITDYVAALQQANVQIGVITNHNKFNLDEFKALRKKAIKSDIHLLPGVELSVADGNNGIHTLVVFSDEWLDGGDHINAFLTATFQGKVPEQYEHEDGRSSEGLQATIDRLEKAHKDFFLVFAHVEQKSGLWKELGGGRIKELGQNHWFKQRTLGFQMVRSYSKLDKVETPCAAKIKQHLNGWYPAEVEGSDPKQISEIGKGKACYIKIGEPSFDAVKFALFDHKNRVSNAPKTFKHSFIKQISFEGAGTLGGNTIKFSPELNTLIGIRGSGKSSVLEAIRYALSIPFGVKTLDIQYKEGLVSHLLSSGGKVVIEAIDKHGQQYQVSRIYGQLPDVLVNGITQPGVSIRETVLHQPIYFGQKDLSSTGEGFENDLIEKLVGELLTPIRQKVDIQKQIVIDVIKQIKGLKKDRVQKHEWEQKKLDAEHKLKFYQEHGVEQKLQKQIDFDQDERKLVDAIVNAKAFYASLSDFIEDHQLDLNAFTTYTSKQNQQLFVEFQVLFTEVLNGLKQLSQVESKSMETVAGLEIKLKDFRNKKQELKEEFAEIERKLATGLHQAGVQSIRTDEFRRLKSLVDQSNKILEVLGKSDERHEKLRENLTGALTKLEQLRQQEFAQIEQMLVAINDEGSPLQIQAVYKSGKNEMFRFLQDKYRGSGIRGNTLQGLVDEYDDFPSMRADWKNLTKDLSNPETFQQYFEQNLEALLTWQVPNHYSIKYYNKALQHHSLGQRASALMLFVLNQKDNDVVIIDQPEDDLDNQTIYDDVIKLVRKLKPSTQFIFATHNANIPVLGDADQVICCNYEDNKVTTSTGSIDNKTTQERIVTIMEGGKEAFEKRKQVYEAWKP